MATRGAPAVLTHIDKAEASRFRPDQAAAPRTTFSGQATLPQLCMLFVTSEHPSNFSRGDTNVSGRNINVGTNMFAQFGHKSNTELSDLAIGFSLRVEVCATFAAAHVHLYLVRILFSRFVDDMIAYVLSRRS